MTVADKDVSGWQVHALKGKRQVGSLTSADGGAVIDLVCTRRFHVSTVHIPQKEKPTSI